MDGVFINLLNYDVNIKHSEGNIIVPGNPDLQTPVKQILKIHNKISATINVPLGENDIHYLQATKWFNTNYNKINRSEQSIMIDVPLINPFVKYPFTQEQIDKINEISNGRTRLLIMSKEEAKYWSNGNFECPFRNYRLFVPDEKNESLVEYPIPKTYLDSVVKTLGTITKKIGL